MIKIYQVRCLNCNKVIEDNQQFCDDNCRDAMGVKECRYGYEKLYFETPVIPPREPEPLNPVGYIYVLQCQEFYKIGIADDIKKRMASLQTGNPIKLRLILCQRHSDYKTMERWYHQKFRAKQIQGEWFKLSDDDVEWLAGMFVKYMINNPRM